MTKRTLFAGAMVAVLVTGIAVVDAQGRRGPIPQANGRQNAPALDQGPQNRPGLRQGPQLKGRGLQALGAPGRGMGRPGRGGRMGGGPLAGLRSVGLTDAQQTQVKAIFDAAEAERLAARTKTENAILAILTPEQKAKLGKGGK